MSTTEAIRIVLSRLLKNAGEGMRLELAQKIAEGKPELEIELFRHLMRANVADRWMRLFALCMAAVAFYRWLA